MKSWTVLAYLVGDDKGDSGRLDDAIASELKAICEAADFSRINLVVQVDFLRRGRTIRVALSDPPADRATIDRENPLARVVADAAKGTGESESTTAGGKVRRLRTSRRRPAPSFAGRMLQSIQGGLQVLVAKVVDQPDQNAADQQVLEDFLKFARTECPAQRYFLYFFGHASGPLGLFYDAEAVGLNPTSLRLNDLADSLEDGLARADVVLFRDCFMSTLEAAYQLQGCADFLIATQAEAPINGVWPWHDFMENLEQETRPKEAAEAIINTLTRFLAKSENRRPFADVPYALLETRKAPGLTQAIRDLVAEMEGLRTDAAARRIACIDALDAARIGAPTTPDLPGDPALLDVATACKGLMALHPDPLAGHAQTLARVLADVAPVTFSVLGHHTGVGLFYGPTTPAQRKQSFLISTWGAERLRDRSYYRELALSKATGWGALATKPLARSPSLGVRLYSAVFKR